MDFFDLAGQAQEDKMENSKPNTLQQRFGFNDGDMKTPKHDEIMLWLNDNVRTVLSQLNSLPTDLLETRIEECRTDARFAIKNSRGEDFEWPGLGDVPEPKPPEISVIWEKPITTRSQFVVGFIDMLVKVEYWELDIAGIDWSGLVKTREKLVLSRYNEAPRWQLFRNTEKIVFEVKSTIPSLGELIRQVRMYQEFMEATYVVVCPDDRFAAAIASQGIQFVRYPN